nr:hypothetical protein [Tanacetum cinerariifolium]
EPAGAFTAGRALPAAFVMIKAREIPGILHDARCFVHRNEATRAEHGARHKAPVAERLIRHQAVFTRRRLED